MTAWIRLVVVFALATSVAAQSGVDFETHVLPILEQRCVKCHKAPYQDDRGRTRKPKGDLRLDGVAWILRGGEGGPAIVPDAADSSPLYQRVILPDDDSDKMPQKGDPMTAYETEKLRVWIDSGADFGGWVGALGPDEPVSALELPRQQRLLAELSQGVAEAAAGAMEKAAGGLARIAPVQPLSPLLRVEYSSHEAEAADEAVQRLTPLRAQITHLSLARTSITDAALSTVGKMPRLTRLDLRMTAVSDRGLARLSKLSNLRYLNLYGTAVTDQGLAALASLTNLESLYVWQTGVTDAGLADLREELPTLRVHSRVVLPTVPIPIESESGRGR